VIPLYLTCLSIEALSTSSPGLSLTCYFLTAIPEWIQNYTSLQEFEISGCRSLTSLPEGMRSLTSLQRLKIDSCRNLLKRCEREVGEDWPKIAHIPNLELWYILILLS
jgi:hypothetical protein